MSEPLTARRIFDAISAERQLKYEFMAACCYILDVSPDDPPFEKFSFDEYDSSFELRQCADDLRFDDDQAGQLFAMGFKQFWLNHLDGTETFYAMVDGGIVWSHK